MTMYPDGGPAIPVSVNTDRAIQGGVAIPVYGYASAPTDGRPAQAGAAMPVRVLTAADLVQNGGRWVLEGRTAAMPVYTAPSSSGVMGGPAIAVYPVNAWPPSSAPVTPWYLAGGITPANCKGAWAGTGAASYAASKVNLANPGTNDLTTTADPTWAADSGWTADGTAFLDTGLVPPDDQTWSLVVQTNGFTGFFASAIGSYSQFGASQLGLIPNTASNLVRYASGDAAAGILDVAPALASGNLIVAGRNGYREGISDGIVPLSAPGRVMATLYILAAHIAGGGIILPPTGGTVQCAAVYDTILTAPQALAIRNAIIAQGLFF